MPSGERIDASRRLSAAKQLSQPVDQELIDRYSDPRYVLGGDWTPRLAPIITTQPTSISFAAGQKATVSCGAVGIPVPSVQWRKNQHEIAGATNTTLTIERVTEQDAGVYTAIFTNTVGAIDSAPAKLTIAHRRREVEGVICLDVDFAIECEYIDRLRKRTGVEEMVDCFQAADEERAAQQPAGDRKSTV